VRFIAVIDAVDDCLSPDSSCLMRVVRIVCVEDMTTDTCGMFVAESFESSYWNSIGNSLRRVALGRWREWRFFGKD
jgi:hypothetical protein